MTGDPGDENVPRSLTGAAKGRAFVKMSGSGNDFLVFDARAESIGDVDQPTRIAALCARGTGVGADGVVFLERSETTPFRMRYHNADGTRAAMCGNAALCITRLAYELGIAPKTGDVEFDSDGGLVRGRMRDDRAEIDLAPVRDVAPTAPGIAPRPGEEKIGFALAGVPHLVISCADVELVDVAGRGAELRRHPTLVDGANVNFVSPMPEGGAAGWRYRTYERGVEGETLACGTGAVATAVLLAEWGLTGTEVNLRASSGEVLTVRLTREPAGWRPALSGPARVVFEGRLAEV